MNVIKNSVFKNIIKCINDYGCPAIHNYKNQKKAYRLTNAIILTEMCYLAVLRIS